MTPQAALIELLARVSDAQGAVSLISDQELNQWPSAAVKAMKSQGLLAKARPASSVVCPGCERECMMPVHVLHDTARVPVAFVICDKRSDINRVSVPVNSLERWQSSGDSIANLLARLLELHCSAANGADASRWEIGMFKGVKYSSHLVLVADDELILSLAGHSIALADVLLLDGKVFKINAHTLRRLVDQPIAGAGDVESSSHRRERLKKRVQVVKAKGTKAFLKTVAEEEGISIPRLKQLVREKSEPTKTRSR